MNPRIPLVIAAAVAATVAIPAPTAAQGTFEGVIDVQVTGGRGQHQTMQYAFKGDKVRMDIASGGRRMYTVYDRASKMAETVIPMRREYVEHSLAPPAAMRRRAGNVEIKWTDRRETIAGYPCRHAEITDAEGIKVDMCLAKGLGATMPMPGGGRGGFAGLEQSLAGSFPLKMVRNGKVEWLVTSVKKRHLADSLFTVPAGYRKMEAPGGGGGGR